MKRFCRVLNKCVGIGAAVCIAITFGVSSLSAQGAKQLGPIPVPPPPKSAPANAATGQVTGMTKAKVPAASKGTGQTNVRSGINPKRSSANREKKGAPGASRAATSATRTRAPVKAKAAREGSPPPTP